MGNSASSLPYAIGKQVSVTRHGWAVHEGSRKSDGEHVSVWQAKKPSLLKTSLDPTNRAASNMTQYATALHHFTQCKKLRHPHILQVHATLDTDNPNDQEVKGMGSNSSTNPASANGDFIVVTEPCVSLDTWLATNPPPEQVAWGLESIVQALHFLHASALSVHGNLSPDSFVVTRAGDVKLWNFSLVSTWTSKSGSTLPHHFCEWEGLVCPGPYRSPERSEKRWDAIAAVGVHAMDSFGLAVLIGHLFHNQIPPALVKAVQRMQTPNLKMRPRLQPLLKCPVFDTPYQKMQRQLLDFPVQAVEQKTAFFATVLPNLQMDAIAEPLAVYRILPMIKAEIQTICLNEVMRTQDAYRKEVLSTLGPLFYIAETFLDSDTVGKQLGSVIGILFKVNDRAIRGTLLQKAPFMASSFDKSTLNNAVFEPMCSGFSDSSSALRELTLKATAALVPHLSHPNLEKLARYLVRLQSDEESSIRTNTVIFFSKLAPYLTETTRQKMLLPAFVRAMKDPFTPCRLAALKSTLKAKEFFDPAGIASRVLPCVTPQLLDSSSEVRREAFQAVDDLLCVLRQESERLNALPEPTMAGSAGGGVAAAPASAQASGTTKSGVPSAPSSGGYLGGISSWMTSKAKPEDAPKSGPTPASRPQAAPPVPMQARAMPVQQQPVSAPPPFSQSLNGMSLNNTNTTAVADDSWGDDDDDGGWGDDDLDVSNDGLKVSSGAVPIRAAAPASSLFAAPAHEDDFFGGFDAKPAKTVAMRKMGGGSGGKLSIPVKKTSAPKPAVKKLAVTEGSVSDGWDDF